MISITLMQITIPVSLPHVRKAVYRDVIQRSTTTSIEKRHVIHLSTHN